VWINTFADIQSFRKKQEGKKERKKGAFSKNPSLLSP
jgi:hypothetical protein